MSLDEIDDQESLDLDKHYENISNNFIGKQKAKNGKMKRMDKKKQNRLFEESKQNQFESNRKRNDADRDEDKDTYSIITNSMQEWVQDKGADSNYEHSITRKNNYGGEKPDQ